MKRLPDNRLLLLRILTLIFDFIRDVFEVLSSIAVFLWRMLVAMENASARLIYRIIRVEKRIRRFWPKLLFPFRWLRFIIYRLHILPAWAKVTKLLIVMAAVFVWQFWGYLSNYQQIQATYAQYYPILYQELKKRNQSDFDARYNAAYLANLYAQYYASKDYKVASRSALPKASAETISYPKNVANAESHLTPQGLALIKRFEGLMLEPYKDVGGKLTIGYGHLIRPGEYFTQVTEKEAEALLLKDVAVAEAVVKRNVKVRINAQQYSALVSLVYNVGQGHFEDSTLLELLNKGDYNGASKQFMRWVHVDGDRIKGLVTRRLAEKELFDS
jgi:lysozyme